MVKHREYVTPDETVVATMVERIVDGFDPERIVLFGSLARGEVTRSTCWSATSTCSS